MTPQTVTLNRWLVGSIAVACFVASGIIAITAPSEMMWWGGLMRAGVVLAALWTCLPTKDRPAAWADFKPLSAALLIAALLLAILRPKVGIPAVVILLAIRYVLTPRRKTSTRRR